MKEYKDDVKEFETLAASKQLEYLSETRSAKALSKRIDKLVSDLDQIVQTLDKKQDTLTKDIQVRCAHTLACKENTRHVRLRVSCRPTKRR